VQRQVIAKYIYRDASPRISAQLNKYSGTLIIFLDIFRGRKHFCAWSKYFRTQNRIFANYLPTKTGITDTAILVQPIMSEHQTYVISDIGLGDKAAPRLISPSPPTSIVVILVLKIRDSVGNSV
jgi:hypothetical protein